MLCILEQQIKCSAASLNEAFAESMSESLHERKAADGIEADCPGIPGLSELVLPGKRTSPQGNSIALPLEVESFVLCYSQPAGQLVFMSHRRWPLVGSSLDGHSAADWRSTRLLIVVFFK